MARSATRQEHADAALIDRMGGSTTAAKLLGIEGPHAAQRVSNWRTRCIPAAVKLAHYHLLVKKNKLTQGGAA